MAFPPGLFQESHFKYLTELTGVNLINKYIIHSPPKALVDSGHPTRLCKNLLLYVR